MKKNDLYEKLANEELGIEDIMTNTFMEENILIFLLLNHLSRNWKKEVAEAKQEQKKFSKM